LTIWKCQEVCSRKTPKNLWFNGNASIFRSGA